MANSFGLLLTAILIIFVIARLMKDAKAFSKLMAIFAISFLVGAGVKAAVAKLQTPDSPEVVSTKSTPMQSSISPFVLEETEANLDPASKDIKVDRDIVETDSEGASTELDNSDYIDDS